MRLHLFLVVAVVVSEVLFVCSRVCVFAYFVCLKLSKVMNDMIFTFMTSTSWFTNQIRAVHKFPNSYPYPLSDI